MALELNTLVERRSDGMINAAVIPARCSDRRLFGMTVEETPEHDWVRVWAFPMTERMLQHEGYEKTSIRGSLNATPYYPGCPYCKTKGFVECGFCKKITCYHEESFLICAWCGKKLTNMLVSNSFDQSIGAF